MLTASEQITTMIKSQVRKIDGRVDIYEGSTLLETNLSTDNIKKFTIERIGDESKFSGYGICQKLNLHLIDKDRTRNYTTDNTLDIAYGVNGEYTYPYPLFKISRVNRDDKTGELSITAYDKLYESGNHTISEVEGWNSFGQLNNLVKKCADFLGLAYRLGYDYDTGDNGLYTLTYPEGANLSGNETIREVLDSIAEVNHMIYFIDSENRLVFKRLNGYGTVVVDSIEREDYFELEVGDNKKLSAICHTTELGENIISSYDTFKFRQQPKSIAAAVGETVSFYVFANNAVSYQWYNRRYDSDVWNISDIETANTRVIEIPVTEYGYQYEWKCVITDANGNTLDSDGVYILNPNGGTQYEITSISPLVEEKVLYSTQYIRNNQFIELKDDIGIYLDNLIHIVGNFTIRQFECKWRGNFLLEIGDKLWIKTKAGEADSNYYLLDDVVTYDGTLSEITKWRYNNTDTETETNATSLGDALKQTFARVDKANKQIELVASDVSENKTSIASLTSSINSINATVTNIETNTSNAISGINDSIGTLTNKVEAQITAEDVSLSISSALSNGVSKVETETGFTFNEAGLIVSKSDSEMTTQITEDGMTVFKESEAVLVANNNGVDAENLHATTYLIIGDNSRFENYGSNRTGCFWIGG